MSDIWVKTFDPAELAVIPGLQGTWKRFLDASEASGGLVVGMGALAAGETAGWHEHPEPEMFFVLEGTALAKWRDDDGEHQHELAAGQAFFKPGNVPHQMVNLTDGTFRGIFIKLAAL
jgi:quercetin dioxygenase-like cupin family protein